MKERRKTCAAHSFTVQGVIIALGSVAVLGTFGCFVLAFYERPVPGELYGIIGVAVGGLSAILSKVETGGGVQPVTVENSQEDPVPVTRPEDVHQ